MSVIDILLGVFFVWVVVFFLYIILADADMTLLYYHKFGSRKELLRNQVVWITGASSGIGEYLAYSLIKHKAKLALSGVNIERLGKVKSKCIELTGCPEENVLLVPFSVEKFEEHDSHVNKVLEHFGHIDILVNNAGVSQRADFPDIDIEVDQKLFSVNVFGSVNLTRKVLKHFLEQKKGHVVVTSSLAGKMGAPYSSAYTGSKHALHGYFECLRTEMIGRNIDVTIVCPGPVFSQITDRCVTGKLGEKFDHTQKPTDRKMKTDRCGELMVSAIAHKLDECWICIQPLLILFYLSQYCPTVFKRPQVSGHCIPKVWEHLYFCDNKGFLKKFFSKELAKKLRQGQ